MTSLDRFRGMVEPGRVVPVWREIVVDTDTPLSAFARLRRPPFSFLLESAPGGAETWARYSFIGTEPSAAWRLAGSEAQRWTPEGGWSTARRCADPFEEIRQLAASRDAVHAPELGPFWTGIVGFLGYDVVRHIERLPDTPAKGLPLPDGLFVVTDTVVIMDNLKGTARIVTAVQVPQRADDAAIARLHADALQRIDRVVDRLRTSSTLGPLELHGDTPPAKGTSTMTQSAYIAAVERAREYILAGDCFQVVLARRIDVEHDFDSTTLYRALRVTNPSPYMYHLELDGLEIVGSSPELQVRLSDGRVTVRPIAGTRRRGATAAEDARLGEELLADPKERAEHVMLVDLARNDVSRVARAGTVRVGELMVVERFSHVLHMTSEVTGDVSADTDAVDVFRATFPAGTVSGAPKVRAMEIIDELEPERRGPYAGAVGYIAGGGRRMDAAIAIRTCVIANGVASVQAGAGIVADSVPEREWEETESKARALLGAIAMARRTH